MSLDITLDSINEISNSKEKVSRLNETIDGVVGLKGNKKPNSVSIIKICKFVVNKIGENETSASKPVLDYLVQELEKVEEDHNTVLLKLCLELMEIIRGKQSYFAAPLVKVIRILAEIYQSDDEFKEAGRIMQSIDTEDQYFTKAMSIIERCDWRIQTAQLFLEDKDNTSATRHIVVAKKLLRDVPTKSKDRLRIQLQHKTCYSRILDSERKFLAASVNYLELSQISSEELQVKENDLLISLENAVTCAILAPAGGNRTRVLAMLYRDGRSKQLKNYRVLERMHKNMLLPRKEMDAFANTLEEHHQATLAGGLTVLEKAVYEHNMLAASQIYKNVRISELSKLLGVNDMQAEDLARIMIQEGRMSATIDQVEETIEFHSKKGSELLE